ncbi:unnamed protein product [Caenorhabditis auriculariae]|uniref:BZIP domain-containing protein n=1 Tax=Caenorhabditis auriculariae TaxID=2777116 RepID=A0A8S1H1M7_9PELO|nr:unnamed protein product [Caenorhabditis auriculariae]
MSSSGTQRFSPINKNDNTIDNLLKPYMKKKRTPKPIINDTPRKQRNREAARKYRNKKDNLIFQLREQNETLLALLKQKEDEIQLLREAKEFQWCQCLMTQSRMAQMSGNNATDPIADLPLEFFGMQPSEEANPLEQHY